ncbi:DUF6124 family protein [Pseudomonas antarctica]|uniref:DUF6124 family protein n=1 Tax=Pseudomonas antarctica TaxID=219572 RepID=UPI0039C17D2E
MRAGSLSLPCSLARYARTDLFTVDPETRFESALVHASSLLHCASATAQEAGERLDGTSADAGDFGAAPGGHGEGFDGSSGGVCRAGLR